MPAIENLFATKDISFELAGESYTYNFSYTFLTRTDRELESFILQPEGLSLVARWRAAENSGNFRDLRFKGPEVQFYYKTRQMKDQLGLIIKPPEDDAVFNSNTVSFYKKYPFLSPEEKLENQNNETYKRVYAGKKQKDLETLLLKQVEIYHRGNYESPNISTKRILLFLLDFCRKFHLRDQFETEGKLDIEKILLYLKENEYKILHQDLLEQNLLSILEKERISQAIKDKFVRDEQGYVNYGILPPVIRLQIKQRLEELQKTLGEQFTLEDVSLTLYALIEKRGQEKMEEIRRNNLTVPTHAYANSQEGIEAKGFAYETVYIPSPEEFAVLKDNKDKAAVDTFKKRKLGSALAKTKQPVPGFNTVPPGYTELVDAEGNLVAGAPIVGVVYAKGKENDFYPASSYIYFQAAPDPAAMFEDMKKSILAIERLNFYVRRTMDGLGGSFSLERDRLTFVIPINGDESKEELAVLEQKVRDAFGLTDNYYLRAGFPQINKQRKIVGAGDNKLTEPYYSFDFNIGPDYFLNEVLLRHHHKAQQTAPQEMAPLARGEEKVEEENMPSSAATPSPLEQQRFYSDLRDLSNSSYYRWDSIFRHCKTYPMEAYTTIRTQGPRAHVYETPLHWICFAASNDHLNKAKLLGFFRLPEVSQHVNIQNGWGYTPLHEAIIRKASPEFIQVLIDFGADPNSLATAPYKSPLQLLKAHEASQYSALDLSRWVISQQKETCIKLEQQIRDLGRRPSHSAKYVFMDRASSFMGGDNNKNRPEQELISLNQQLDEEKQILKNLEWVKQILEENGAKTLNPSSPLRGEKKDFYGEASYSTGGRVPPQEGWGALIAQRCASAILTDREQNVLHVHLPTIENALALADQHQVKIIDIIMPDAFLNQGLRGTTLLQIACRKGQIELASMLLSKLKQEQEKTGEQELSPTYCYYIQEAFKEFEPLLQPANADKEDHKIAAAAILRTLLEDYPEHYPHFEAGFQKFIKKLVFECREKDPALYEAFRNALTLVKRNEYSLGHSSKVFKAAPTTAGRKGTLPITMSPPSAASQSTTQLTRRSSTQQ